MTDNNATRLPGFIFDVVTIAYVGDDVSHTLNRGERWAQQPSNNVLIVLMCCVLAFVERWIPGLLLVVPSYDTKVLPFSLLNVNTIILWTWADTSCRYQAWNVKPISEVRIYLFQVESEAPVNNLQTPRADTPSHVLSLFCWIHYLAIKVIKPTSMIRVWYYYIQYTCFVLSFRRATQSHWVLPWIGWDCVGMFSIVYHQVTNLHVLSI